MVLGNPKFDVYRLPDEHRMLREAVRALADDKIAPRAAKIDETRRVAYDILDALVRAGYMRCTSPRSMAAQEQTPSPQRS